MKKEHQTKQLLLVKTLYEHAKMHVYNNTGIDRIIAIHNLDNSIEWLLKSVALKFEIKLQEKNRYKSLKDLWDEIEIVSVPGVSSVFAAACKVGAPLSQDFAVISLSDRLTDPDMINKRIFNALDADFVVAIYNPKSKKRKQPYLDFLDILNKFDERIVTVAQNVGREAKEHIAITTSTDLINQGLEHEDVGMSTLLIVGNSNSRLTKNGQILTPRGYLHKYDTDGDLK